MNLRTYDVVCVTPSDVSTYDASVENIYRETYECHISI